MEFITHSQEETIALGRRLARHLQSPCVIALWGDLGSGKTTLTKGIVGGLGVAAEEDVTSPTFTLVHDYGRKVYHADLYRIEGATDLATLGLDEVLASDSILIVEWPDKLGETFSVPRINITFDFLTGDDRKIVIEGLEL